MIKIYTYKKCDTCVKAIRFLRENNLQHTELAIRETPPSKTELKQMLEYYDGDIKKLFNTSGRDYRALDMKSKLPLLSQDELLTLLSENGNLVKRPFLLDEDKGCVGFKDLAWATFFYLPT